MSHIDKLKEKINTDTAIVTVIGLGYVGLPLALECCKAGMNVFGFDVVRKMKKSEKSVKELSGLLVDQHTFEHYQHL